MKELYSQKDLLYSQKDELHSQMDELYSQKDQLWDHMRALMGTKLELLKKQREVLKTGGCLSHTSERHSDSTNIDGESERTSWMGSPETEESGDVLDEEKLETSLREIESAVGKIESAIDQKMSAWDQKYVERNDLWHEIEAMNFEFEAMNLRHQNLVNDQEIVKKLVKQWYWDLVELHDKLVKNDPEISMDDAHQKLEALLKYDEKIRKEISNPNYDPKLYLEAGNRTCNISLVT